jgi:cysteine synthase
MNRLRQKATTDDSILYPGQYDNENVLLLHSCFMNMTDHEQNWKAHETWTGPQILRQLPEINIFCTTVGTGGRHIGEEAPLLSS